VPLSETTVGDPVALLATEMEPEALPAVAGVKVTDIVTDWFGVRVVFGVTPLAENGPLGVIAEIVTLELPVFVSVTFCELFEPTWMFAKVTLVGLAVRT
jgi:hypothetical protein